MPPKQLCASGFADHSPLHFFLALCDSHLLSCKFNCAFNQKFGIYYPVCICIGRGEYI